MDTHEIIRRVHNLQAELDQIATARFSPAKTQLACHNLVIALIPEGAGEFQCSACGSVETPVCCVCHEPIDQ